MRASRAFLAAAGLILAAGSATFGAAGAAPGMHAPAPTAVSAWRGHGPRLVEERSRHDGRRGRDGFNWPGLVAPGDGEAPVAVAPAADEEAAPQAAVPYPLSAAPCCLAEFSGPRLIEVGDLAPVAPGAALPVVIYGDSMQ